MPEPAQPAVDFNRHMVLGIAADHGADTCAGMSLTGIYEEPTRIRVE